MEVPFEPFRIRVVEPIRLTTRAEREQLIQAAGLNPFLLAAEHVLVDLVTDSGTSALSTRQLQALVGADESFTGSRSYHRFRAAAAGLFGHRHVIPCHQGRAAEHLLARALLRPGHVVFANTLFSTTRENIEEAGAVGLDLPIPDALDPESRHPFKGNVDVDALVAGIDEVGADNVPFVVVTVTDNSRGGQPVSLANLRAVAEVCRATGVALLLDAARFAENAYLVTLREDGQGGRPPRDVAREMFALADGVFMSLKKDAFGNTGGIITLQRDDWAEKVREKLLSSEGIPMAGGLAGRDMEVLAASFDEILDESYLAYRVATTSRLGTALGAAGVPVVQPFGAHAIYVDGRRFCPHLRDGQLPAWSLSVAYYVASGVRTWEIGNVMQGRPGPDGRWTWPALDLLRLAVPRRVYTSNHLDYAAATLAALYRDRDTVRGLRFVYRPPTLAQFVATFEYD